MTEITYISSITDITQEDYDKLQVPEYPFIKYRFLKLLESSDSVGGNSGWQVHHLIIKENHQLIGFMPLFIKQHSYGEYVFDFQWAKAYDENGIDYYPKLLTAIPFTPVMGPRILVHQDYPLESQINNIINSIKNECESRGFSSWHLLFTEMDPEKDFKIDKQGLLSQKGVQFHWYNQDHQNFDDFLMRLNKRKRKEIRRERKKIQQQRIHFTIVEGAEITEQDWEDFYLFYQLTYMKRSGHGGYLSKNFFNGLSRTIPENILLINALQKDHKIASALFFKDKHSLYGRYWGSNTPIDFLHFETCYYQGIEYCIHHQLEHFDSGAQGEHKIQRGFVPVFTYSGHWLKHEGFREAIGHYLKSENRYTENYFELVKEHSPYKI